MKHLLQFFLVVCSLSPAVLSAQNIGIGTTTPADRLTVRSATGGLGISQETPDGTVRVGFYTTPAAGAYLQTHTNHDLQFATNNGLAQMVLQRGTGFVGIGIAAPLATLHLRGAGAERLRLENSAALALNVRNDIVFRTGSFFTGQIRTVGTGTNAARLGFYTGAQASADEMSERITIGDNGAVGIGTVTPQHPLTFNSVLGDKISFWGGTGSATVGHYGIGIANSALQLYSAGPNDDIVFGHGRSGAFVENVRMKGNGNVGIGTNNPTSRLTVFGNTSGFEHTNGTVSLKTQIFQNNLLAIVGTTTATNMALQANNGANGAEVRILSNGNVGVGTITPQSKLHVDGNVLVDGALTLRDGTEGNQKVLVSSTFGTASWSGPVYFRIDLAGVSTGNDNNGLRIPAFLQNGFTYSSHPGNIDYGQSYFTIPESGFYQLNLNTVLQTTTSDNVTVDVKIETSTPGFSWSTVAFKSQESSDGTAGSVTGDIGNISLSTGVFLVAGTRIRVAYDMWFNQTMQGRNSNPSYFSELSGFRVR